MGIALQILRVAGGKVRVGIEAPTDVAVVRCEIASAEQLTDFAEHLQRTSGKLTHELRNRLNTTLLALHLLHEQLARNLTEEAEQTIARLLSDMQGLDQEIEVQSPEPVADRPRRKALVVEDNSNERRLLAGYLRLAGTKFTRSMMDWRHSTIWPATTSQTQSSWICSCRA